MSFGEGVVVAVVGFLTVFVVLAFIALCISVVSKIVNKLNTKNNNVVKSSDAVIEASNNDNRAYGGDVLLQDVDEKTAACLMGIVCEQLKAKPSELIFKSIRKVEG